MLWPALGFEQTEKWRKRTEIIIWTQGRKVVMEDGKSEGRKEGRKGCREQRERESNREGQQSHSGCCSMREWPVTPPLICVQSALTHTYTHTPQHLQSCHSFSYMKNSHIPLQLIDTGVRNEILLLLGCFVIVRVCVYVCDG